MKIKGTQLSRKEVEINIDPLEVVELLKARFVRNMNGNYINHEGRWEIDHGHYEEQKGVASNHEKEVMAAFKLLKDVFSHPRYKADTR